MKYFLFLPILAIFIFANHLYAQSELKEPILMDEFGTECSEIMSARMDNVAGFLNNTPDSVAVIFLTGKKDEEGKNLSYIDWIESYLKASWEISKDKVVLKRRPNADKRKFQVWFYRKDQIPSVQTYKYSYKISETILFDRAYADVPDPNASKEFGEDEIYVNGFYQLGCEFSPNDSAFANKIRSTPSVNGHIVIFNDSSENFVKVKNYAIGRLVSDFKTPRSRIQVSFGGKTKLPRIEFWLVPQSNEPRKPILVDEVGNIPCGDFLARTDGFLQAILEHPNAIGVVVIHGNEKNPASTLYYERIIEGEILEHKFDRNRLRVIRAKREVQTRIRFWVVPAGAPNPQVEKENYLETIAAAKKASILFTTGGEGYCPFAEPSKLLIEILKLRPLARTNIVIRAETRQHFKKKKAEILKSLTDLPKNRVRFFFVKSNTNPIGDYTDQYAYVEYWFVPRTKR